MALLAGLRMNDQSQMYARSLTKSLSDNREPLIIRRSAVVATEAVPAEVGRVRPPVAYCGLIATQCGTERAKSQGNDENLRRGGGVDSCRATLRPRWSGGMPSRREHHAEGSLRYGPGRGASDSRPWPRYPTRINVSPRLPNITELCGSTMITAGTCGDVA
jgi:hypothetical protein